MLVILFLSALMPSMPVLAAAPTSASVSLPHPARLARHQPPPRSTAIKSTSPRTFAPRSLPLGVGTNVQVSPADSNTYTTTAVAQDPSAPGGLYVSSNINTATPVAGFRTADGGATWQAQTLPLPPNPPNHFAFYPAPTFDAAGYLYEATMPYSNVSATSSVTQLNVFRSTDRGAHWTGPYQVESDLVGAEKPLMAADTSNSAFKNRLYVAYDTNPARSSEPMVVAHSDDGINWQRTTVFDSAGDFGGYPAVGPTGEVYVAWDDYCGGLNSQGRCSGPGGRILLAKSTDGGATFSALGPSPMTIAYTQIGFGTTIPDWSNNCGGAGPIKVNPAPAIAVDRSGGPHNGWVYAVWADPKGQGFGLHIHFSRSTDGGVNWSAPTQVDAANPRDAWQPAVAIDQSNGVVTMDWYQRDGPKLYRTVYTQSADGGTTFLPAAIPVADTLSDASLDCSGTGDYMEMTASGGIAHPVWVDTRNGRPQIFTAAVNETVVAPAAPPAARLGAFTDYPAAGVAPVVADFNGDGKADVAVVDQGTVSLGGVSVLLGNGDGTFQPAITTPSGHAGIALATADFNGDGKPDVVVANIYSNTVTVLMGKGDGTFQPPVDYTLPGNPGAVVAADMNGDGKPDLVVTDGNASGSRVSILLNNGDGTFKAASSTPVPLSNSAVLQVADFNGDGRSDVAVAITSITADYTRAVAVLLGNGDGTLQPLDAANTFSAGGDSRLRGMAAADLNSDGKPDIAVSTYAYPGNLAVLINTSTGGSLSFKAPATYTTRDGFVSSGDFDGDGRPDIAIVGGTNTLAVLLSNPDGTLQSPITSAGGNYPTGLATGDFNRDGKLDVVIAPGSSGGVSIGLGLGNGHFLSARNIPVGWSPYLVAAPDLNGDGRPDILAASHGGATPVLTGLIGNGDGTFKAGVTTPMQGTALAVGDLNGDHLADVVIAGSSGLQVMMGKGDGSFAPPTATYPLTINGRVSFAVLGDFNGDGKVDIAASGLAFIGSNQVGMLWIFTGNGDGTFATTPVAIQLNSTSGGPMVAADFNHDGKLDLAMSVGGPTIGPNGIDVFLNTTSTPGAAPTFAAPVLYGSRSGTVATGDFNRDGNADLAVATTDGLFIFLGKGDGTFQSAVPNGSSGADGVGDINGDGNLDLVAVSSGATISVRLGSGTGLFGPATDYDVDQGPNSLALADFNGDGALDLVVSNGNSNDVSVILGVAPPVQLSTSSVAFGSQAAGTTSAPATVTLTNQGPANLNVASAALQGNNPGNFSISADTCSGHALAAAQSCSVTLTFTPSVPANRDAILRFTDDGTGGLQSVALSGTGTGAGAVISPASLLFDEQIDHTTSQPRTVSVTNNGTAPLAISTLTLAGPAAADFAKGADGCSGASLAVGASCSASYSFTPGATGRRTATVTIADSAFPGHQRIDLTGLATTSVRSAASMQQYVLTGSDGATWENIDQDSLSLHLTPTVTGVAIVNGNADLWTVKAGFNQDLGVAVWGGAYPTVAGQPEAWKESGGFAGTFSPNAAAVQAVLPVVAGTTYVFQLVGKTNVPDPGSIVLGAGPWPSTSANFSPTRLSVKLIPGSTTVFPAKSADQHYLVNSDGTTWRDIDSTSATPLALTVTPPAGSNWVALLSANIDLWTARAGYNQDVGIRVAEADAGTYPGNIVAWKESGGFAGTYSPNAAFVQGVLPMTGGSTYHVTLQWKTNKPTRNDGATIFAGAGGSGAYSPSRLTAILLPVTSLSAAVSNSQFALSASDGANWADLKAGASTPLSVSVTPPSNCLAIISGNVDLWTANAGFNQDLGISVGPSGAAGTIVAWKESGGFAGTYSPNAAFVQAVVPLAATPYTIKLVWKTNKADAGLIVGGAGPWPSSSGAFSPSTLTVQLVDCS